MIKIDLSKLIPKPLATVFLGFIPGLFFVSSIALADPRTVNKALTHVRQIYDFPPYGLVVAAIAICLGVGQIFFLISWFLDILISSLYRSGFFIVRNTAGSDWFYRAVAKLQGSPPKPTSLTRWLWKVNMWGKEKRFFFNIRPVLNCQGRAAEQILKRRYGITLAGGDPNQVAQEWQVWISVLGKPIEGMREAYLAMRTVLGSGVAGVCAIRLEPVLHNRYFVISTLILSLAGVAAAWDFAKLRFQPKRSSFVRLTSLLRELAPDDQAAKTKSAGNSDGVIAADLGGEE